MTGDTIVQKAAGDTIVDMALVRCMQAKLTLKVAGDGQGRRRRSRWPLDTLRFICMTYCYAEETYISTLFVVLRLSIFIRWAARSP